MNMYTRHIENLVRITPQVHVTDFREIQNHVHRHSVLYIAKTFTRRQTVISLESTRVIIRWTTRMPLANKEVSGLTKDENDAIMTDFVGLKAKM